MNLINTWYTVLIISSATDDSVVTKITIAQLVYELLGIVLILLILWLVNKMR